MDNTWKTIGIVVIVAVILFLLFGFTVPVKDVPYEVTVPYNDTEAYSVQEPYDALEPYSVKEPYTDTEYYTYYVTVNVPYVTNVPCGNVCDPIHKRCAPRMCPRTVVHQEQRAMQGSRTVTKYRDVIKERTVTKFRSVEKTRAVTKYRTDTKWKKLPLFINN